MRTRRLSVNTTSIPQAQPPKPKMTGWELVKHMLALHAKMEHRVIEAFVADIQTNPKSALEYSGKAFTAAARYDIIKKLELWVQRWEDETPNKTAEQWLTAVLEHLQEEFMRVARYEGFRSTSTVSNLTEDCYRVALFWAKEEMYRVQCSIVEFNK